MYSVILAAMLTTTADVPQQSCTGYGSCLGCYGYGGAFGCAGGAFACMGCYGGYQSWWSGAGGFSGYGAHVGSPPSPVACCEAPPVNYPVATDEIPATVVVQLPSGQAQFFVEGKPVNIDPATGGFQTPKLAPGNYVYTLRADVVRDGRVVSETKEVRVVPGGVARVRFGDPTGITPVAAKDRGGEIPLTPIPPAAVPRVAGR